MQSEYKHNRLWQAATSPPSGALSKGTEKKEHLQNIMTKLTA